MPASNPDLPPERIQLAAKRFRVLADPTRLSILQCLRDGERSVNEIAARTGVSQPTASKHLAVLTDSRMVARRQVGNRVHCRIVDQVVFQLCDLVCDHLAE